MYLTYLSWSLVSNVWSDVAESNLHQGCFRVLFWCLNSDEALFIWIEPSNTTVLRLKSFDLAQIQGESNQGTYTDWYDGRLYLPETGLENFSHARLVWSVV